MGAACGACGGLEYGEFIIMLIPGAGGVPRGGPNCVYPIPGCIHMAGCIPGWAPPLSWPGCNAGFACMDG